MHFQLSQLPRSDVDKNARNNRRRENCGEVEADVEPSKFFYSSEFECIKSSGDTESTQSARFESHSTKCTENSDLNDEDDSKWPHTITAHLVLTFDTLRKSTRTRDNNSNARQKTNWKALMRIR